MRMHATIDFEGYSEAGCIWDPTSNKWAIPPGATKKGLPAVGAAVYAEHPSTEILCLAYRVPGDPDISLWTPGDPPPVRLFRWIADGGLVEAHNAMFERLIWHHVCRRLHGWPPVPDDQWMCSQAKARVANLPAPLGELSHVLGSPVLKNPDGTRLIGKFCIPRNPTKSDPRTRILPADDPADAANLYGYCVTDVATEEHISALVPDMTPDELRFWRIDQQINWRGVGVDTESVRNMITVMEQAMGQYGAECRALTGGLNPTQIQKLREWLSTRGVATTSLDADALTEALARPNLPPDARRVLEIRSLVGSASVKKLYAIARSTSSDGRVRNTLIHHGARTGRPTGDLLQPLNLPKQGPTLAYCGCGHPHARADQCPWCLCPVPPGVQQYTWPDVPRGYEDNPVDHIQTVMATRSLDTVEYFFGDAYSAIIGCIRGMICAAPGHDLIASDYSAIEAVVTAALSGCRWRMEVFERREDIYLHSAARITGKTYQFYKDYYAEHGSHHPDRQKIGKVAELALGFGGWIGAWRQFDPDGIADDAVKKTILAWRSASPEIPEMWGGQARGMPWDRDYRFERYGFEGAAVNAIECPGQTFEAFGTRFFTRGDALVVVPVSGREMLYQSPRLSPSTRRPGELAVSYKTWNTNPKYGPIGWVSMHTYGPKIAENVIQHVAHDIQRYGIEGLEAAGYPVILHVYDEDICEVPQGFGSIEEVERIMSTMPPWADGWPVRAHGGWRGRRFRKA